MLGACSVNELPETLYYHMPAWTSVQRPASDTGDVRLMRVFWRG